MVFTKAMAHRNLCKIIRSCSLGMLYLTQESYLSLGWKTQWSTGQVATAPLRRVGAADLSQRSVAARTWLLATVFVSTCWIDLHVYITCVGVVF
jgi:hypothetical protein